MIDELITTLSKYLIYIIFIFGWLFIPYFLYKSFQNKRRREWVETQEFKLIKISVPKENEKTPLAAEQMFASLHGIFKNHLERSKEGSLQEHLSFEIASSSEKISFYVWLPKHLKDFIEGQIYAQYPKVEFEEVSDYADRDYTGYHIVGTEIVLNKNDVFPLKTFINFEEVDPLSGITSVLAKIDEQDEDIWIQILVKPVDDAWQEKGVAYINALKEGKSPESKGIFSVLKGGITTLIRETFDAAMTSPLEQSAQPVKLNAGDEAKAKAIEEKIAKLGFGVKIRVGYISKKEDLSAAKIKLRSIVGAFKQFNTVNLNGFQAGSTIIGQNFVSDYKARLFLEEGYVLNIEELASIFHLPNISVETPKIGWTGSKKGEPPENLPILKPSNVNEISVFAETNFRSKKEKFGIGIDDRRRHMYLIGKTGVGKTNMMENMVISDVNAGHGMAVVDPHGEFVERILKYIPKHRINDVIVFDPADNEFPIAFNPLEAVGEDQKTLVTSGLVSIFNKIWAESWGPRMEYILRNTIISLLHYPNSTMLGILRILVDNDYRKKVVDKIDDPVIKDFWLKEFAQYNERTRVDAILPIQNKVGQFLSSQTIRNIVGQPKSKLNIRDIMDNNKILLIKLAQGQIGEDNSALLGAMMITKMQLAAMSRIDTPEKDRKDFYLYVDEFQNFATDSFAKILSEARKYRLNLTLANQYIAQLSEPVRDAIFGNMGSMVSFRVGANDAKFLVKEYEPVFDETDLVNLDKYHIYLKLSIDGITGNAFSSKTIKIPDPEEDNTEKIIKSSRERYATDRGFVVQKMSEWAEEQNKNSSQASNSTNGEVSDRNSESRANAKLEVSYKEYSDYLESIKQGHRKEDEITASIPKIGDKNEKVEKTAASLELNGDNILKKHTNVEQKVDIPKSVQIKELTSKILKDKSSDNNTIEAIEQSSVGDKSTEELVVPQRNNDRVDNFVSKAKELNKDLPRENNTLKPLRDKETILIEQKDKRLENKEVLDNIGLNESSSMEVIKKRIDQLRQKENSMDQKEKAAEKEGNTLSEKIYSSNGSNDLKEPIKEITPGDVIDFEDK